MENRFFAQRVNANNHVTLFVLVYDREHLLKARPLDKQESKEVGSKEQESLQDNDARRGAEGKLVSYTRGEPKNWIGKRSVQIDRVE